VRDVRYLLSLLPANNNEAPPHVAADDPADRRTDRLLDLVPIDSARVYDMCAVIAEIVDDGEFLQVHAGWAANVVCALTRLDGHVVGIVANQPATRSTSRS
jgi:acetyl-CoA carboxylase carboxyltransferase component